MKTSIKIITVSLAVLFAHSQSIAGDKSMYAGFGLGYSNLDITTDSVYSVNTAPTGFENSETYSESAVGGFGYNMFLGYNFNKHFSVEGEYTKFAKSKYESDQMQVNTGTNTLVGTNTSSLEYSTQSVNLFIKGSMKVQSKLSVFGKIGAAYVSQDVDFDHPAGTPTIGLNSNRITTPDAGSETYTAVRPAGGVGLTYHFSENVGASLFAEGVLGEGDMDSDKDAIADAYLVGATITYSFS